MTLKTYQTLQVEKTSDHVLTVTLNRPEVLNALNTQMMTDLRDCFAELYVDTDSARVVVLTGAGDRAFCAGGDLKERNGMSDETWRRQHSVLEQMANAMMACPIPVVAAVNGSCFGGGLELALIADFIYASEQTKFGLPEGKLGIMPGACGTQNLVRACGQRRAKEIVLTGLPFSAKEALQWGIVNQIYTPDELLNRVYEVSEAISTTAPISARQIKLAIDVGTQIDLKNGYAFELAAYNNLVPTKDRLEGVAAFNEKRKPVFKGE